ncbi:MAG: MBL fold metallo-hydrolase [Christensenellales bacterium]|jgi:hydroxyacylglutathione hydrolase
MKEFVEVHELVPERLWALDEIRRTTMFVVNGDDRAMLVDTGFGLSDLRGIVSRLCGDKPVLCVNTHAHGDHNSGNSQFNTVAVGRFDEPFSHNMKTPEQRETGKKGLLSFIGNSLEGYAFDPAAWKPGSAGRMIPLTEGDKLELGGMIFRVMETPGHTLGSIALLEESLGWLFTGDTVLTWEVWGQLGISSALRVYADSLERLAALEDLTWVYPAHAADDPPEGYERYRLPPELLRIYAEGTRRIVDGKEQGRDYTEKNPAFCGMRYVLFSCGGMAYDPERI